MAGQFAHLHLHTAYSLLDGAIRLKDLFARVLELGMTSVAMTDHGNMFGAIDFYKKAKERGVKPIFGCETYVAADRKDRTARSNHHLILLARNEEGFRNLTFLNSKAFLEGFYYHPRVDRALLRERTGGLIGMSACLGGEIAQTVLREGVARAKEVARSYASIFEPGAFYLEIMHNGLEEQAKVNEAYREISQDLGLPVVATNDCHYLKREDSAAHGVLLCIQQKKTIHDEKRLRHQVDEYFLKSQAEMEAHFHDWPEALENAARIAELCTVELKLGKPMLPRYRVPEGFELDSYVAKRARDGLEERFVELTARGDRFDPDEYRARLEYELGVIVKMGFSGYFLIVADFINWAKEHDVPVGPGRGSGAGSIAAYALKITDIDPIPFKLLFERFLNPERVSMPDFDVDFCMNKRDRVIAYVQEKYGKDNVGQIATFHQLKSRGCVRDVARALDIPLAEADKIAKLVPEPHQGKPPKIDEAIAQEPRLKALYDTDARVKELLDYAKKLEGLNRHVGMHAAGVVIGEQPLWEIVPCFAGDGDMIVTQYAKEEVEAAGLVKFDFLGLKTLTVIDTAVKIINGRRAAGEPKLDIRTIPIADAEVYRMIGAGDTTGVFQLESSGMREMLKKLKPDCIEDIVAAVALYRPGPLQGGMVDDFIDRKHGKKVVVYPHPTLEPILKDTYGVIVYQEQVMQIAQVLAGYTLGGADLLRRAMGKKKAEEMAKQKAKFLDGARGLGVDAKLAEEVFDLMAKFAEYGFNRSHSAAYALVTYQTAYLKRHFPHEFMAGLLSCDKDNTDNIVKFIAEARAMGLTVERPDVNESELDFTVVEQDTGKGDRKKVIRFGLGAVKGVGEGAVEVVLASRADGEPFKSVFDFAERVDAQKVNRRVLEALVKAGAFDGVARCERVCRAQMLAALDGAIERAAQVQRDKKSGQTSLFAFAPMAAAPAGKNGAGGAGGGAASAYPRVEEWSPKQLLAFEKESLGFYITGHPLDRFKADLSRYANCNTSRLDKYADKDEEVSIGGVVTEYRERPTKAGTGRVAFFNLEDPYGKVEVIVFPKTWEKVHDVLGHDEPLLCRGKVKNEGDMESSQYKLFLDEAVPLAQLRAERTSRVHLFLNADDVRPEQIAELKSILSAHRGSCETFLHMKIPMRSEAVIPLGRDFTVAPSEELLLRIERLFGEPVALLR